MDTVWERIKQGLKDGAVYSMEKIEEYSRIGKLKVEEIAAKRRITRNFIDIGERVFDLVESEQGSKAGGDLAVKASIENIKALRDEIEDINRKISDIQERGKKSGSPSAEDEDITGV